MSIADLASPSRSDEGGGGSPRELFVLVAASLLMASMQFAMLSVALVDVVEDLGAPVRWAGWTLSVFTMAQAVSMPLCGRLSDGWGRRRTFLAGTSTFGLASLVCAVSPDLTVLVIARALQGAAAGSLLPSAYGIVGDVARGAGRTRSLGFISSVMPIGSIVGPTLGGWLVDVSGWRATFLVNVPLAIVVVLWGWRRLPPSPTSRQGGSMDLRGAALLTAAVVPVMLALTSVGDAGAGVETWLMALAGVVLGGLLTVVFLRREATVPSPLVEVALLRRPEFAYVNGLNFVYGMCVFGLVSFVPLYVQDGFGFSPAESGLLLTPRAVAMIGASILASVVLDATGFRRPIVVGLSVIGASAALLASGAALPGDGSHVVSLAVVSAVLGVGLGIAAPSVNQSGLDLVPDQVAAITGLRGMFRALGGVVGTAAMAAMASRAATPAEGLQHAFVAAVGLAAVGVWLTRGIPDRPVDESGTRPVPDHPGSGAGPEELGG